MVHAASPPLLPHDATGPLAADALCRDAQALVAQDAGLAALLGFDPVACADDAVLIAEVLAGAGQGATRAAIRAEALALLAPRGALFDLMREDARVTALRDQDPGGPAAALLFANGLHCLLGYRLAHAVLTQGRGAAAHALKGQFLRAFGADIMPAARIGRRVWIDHGLGIVIGQTAVIGDDVSLWHGVTLGTDLVARGENRHPRIEPGAIIGAGVRLIGPIVIGAGAVVAAGATVTENVPPRAIAVGEKARILAGRARPAAEFGISLGELG